MAKKRGKTVYAKFIFRKAGQREDEYGFKTEKRNINNLQYANDTTWIAKNANELKALVIKAKEHYEKNGARIKYKQDSMTNWRVCSVCYTSWQSASSVTQDAGDDL